MRAEPVTVRRIHSLSLRALSRSLARFVGGVTNTDSERVLLLFRIPECVVDREVRWMCYLQSDNGEERICRGALRPKLTLLKTSKADFAP